VALQEAEQTHEKHKQASSIYKSIFSSSPDPAIPQKPTSLTGIYFAKH